MSHIHAETCGASILLKIRVPDPAGRAEHSEFCLPIAEARKLQDSLAKAIEAACSASKHGKRERIRKLDTEIESLKAAKSRLEAEVCCGAFP